MVGVARRVDPAERQPRDLVAVPQDEPEGRLESRALDEPLAPLLDRLVLVLPVVGEGLLVRGVDRRLVLRLVRGQAQPVRPLGRGDVAEVDGHPERVAIELVARALDHASHGLVDAGGIRHRERARVDVRLGALLQLAQQRLAGLGVASVHAHVEPRPVALPLAPAVGVADEPPVPLRDEHLELLVREPRPHLVVRELCGAPVLAGDRVQELGDRAAVAGARLPQRRGYRARSATSSSRASARPSSDGSVRSGCASSGSGSPSRLIQTLVIPSRCAGSMSW